MIEVNNLTTVPINKDFFKKISQKVFRGEKKTEVYLSIALVGPTRMRKMNKEYRGKNRTTDVLAFPEVDIFKKELRVGPLKKFQNLGEIIICPREVKKNAKRFNSNFQTELARVLIHGILHLLGYDHEKSEERAKNMEKKQQHYLELWRKIIS